MLWVIHQDSLDYFLRSDVGWVRVIGMALSLLFCTEKSLGHTMPKMIIPACLARNESFLNHVAYWSC